MRSKIRKTQKFQVIEGQKVKPEVAKLIKEISTKYEKVWQDLAKI